MNTLTKTILAIAGLLLVGGVAVAQDQTRTGGPAAFGPGWRHQQMAEAWVKGEMPQGPMMMMMMRDGTRRGPGMMMGQGPGRAALNPDGTIDTAKLPEWCPYAPKADTK